jgi:hypothetical protein
MVPLLPRPGRNPVEPASSKITHHFANESERTLRAAANGRKIGRTNKTIRGARRRIVLTSVLESLRLSRPEFTLGHVL